MKRSTPEGGRKGKVRAFSVELRTRDDLRSVALEDGSSGAVLVEGTIGELVRARFAEGAVLEIVGEEGVLRVELSADEIAMVDGEAGLGASP